MSRLRVSIALVVLAAFSVSCGDHLVRAAAVSTSQPASIRVIDADALAKAVRDAKGSVVVASFWATWCPPCVREMPELARFVKEHQTKEMVFLGVSVDHPETIDTRVKPFLEKQPVPFDVLVLGETSPEKTAEALGIDWDGAVPATFVFDRAGRLSKMWVEEVGYEDLEAAVNAALGR